MIKNVILSKFKNIKKNKKFIYHKFSKFLFPKNRKNEIKTNMFSKFKSFKNKNNFQKNENRK